VPDDETAFKRAVPRRAASFANAAYYRFSRRKGRAEEVSGRCEGRKPGEYKTPNPPPMLAGTVIISLIATIAMLFCATTRDVTGH